MIRDIIIYPDSSLFGVSEYVEFDGPFDLAALGKDLIDTMVFTKGAAIAAVQVGVPMRGMAIDMPFGPRVFWNPKLLWVSEERHTAMEGCLSVPGVQEYVERPLKVEIAYLNEKGKLTEETLVANWARAALHEIEHMDGKLLTSALGPVKLQQVNTQMKKLHRAAKKLGITTSELVYGRPD
jgi:peptide deformylase